MRYYILSEDFLREQNMLAFDNGCPVVKDKHGDWLAIPEFNRDDIIRLKKRVEELENALHQRTVL